MLKRQINGYLKLVQDTGTSLFIKFYKSFSRKAQVSSARSYTAAPDVASRAVPGGVCCLSL